MYLARLEVHQYGLFPFARERATIQFSGARYLDLNDGSLRNVAADVLDVRGVPIFAIRRGRSMRARHPKLDRGGNRN